MKEQTHPTGGERRRTRNRRSRGNAKRSSENRRALATTTEPTEKSQTKWRDSAATLAKMFQLACVSAANRTRLNAKTVIRRCRAHGPGSQFRVLTS